MTLQQTIHVAADGEVTRGIVVRDEARNYGQRAEVLHGINARRAHSRRFVPAGIPSNVWVADTRAPYGYRRTDILSVTAEHDCANHLTGVEQ